MCEMIVIVVVVDFYRSSTEPIRGLQHNGGRSAVQRTTDARRANHLCHGGSVICLVRLRGPRNAID